MRFIVSLIVLLSITSSILVNGFMIPGMAATNYNEGDPVLITVNRLDSPDTAFPFEYGHFDFCPLEEYDNDPSENLGEKVFGDRLHVSTIKTKMNVNITCQQLCTKHYNLKEEASAKAVDIIAQAIDQEYLHHWSVDELPFAEVGSDDDGNEEYYIGFHVGLRDDTGQDGVHRYVLNNHYALRIDITEEPHRIVGATIEVFSIEHKEAEGDEISCDSPNPQHLFTRSQKDSPETYDIIYTYSVEYVPSSTPWATRWDHYLKVKRNEVHLFSIINSLVIVVFLSAMVGMILLKTLHKDIARYNKTDINLEEAEEEFGWKLCHADVFRPPSKAMLLSVFVGNGVQLFLMFFISILLACMGIFAPVNRGYLITGALVIYVLLGIAAGYSSARLYKMFGGEKWKTNVLMTAFFLPGTAFVVFFILNIVLWHRESSNAIPVGALFELLGLWIGVSAPLCFVGAYFGFRRPTIDHPVRTNQIPRQIPPQPLYLKPIPSMLMGGILPFGAIFIELYFILDSLWSHWVYYMFGFLLLVAVIFVLTCSEVAVLLCYFHLCSEDYHWWWQSFLSSSSSAFYLFLYHIFYFGRLSSQRFNGFENGFLYFGYSLIICYLVFFMTGIIGFYACFYFTRKIYGSIKVD